MTDAGSDGDEARARRSVLALFAAAGAGAVAGAAATPAAAQPAPSGRAVARDRRALALLGPEDGPAWLAEPGREGWFHWQAGAIAARRAADPAQGLHAPGARGDGAWVRWWDGVHGRPEWFGARTGDAAFDCRPALDACVALCPVTLLAPADYWMAGTWRVATPYRTVMGGTPGDGYETGHGPRLICTDPATDVVRVGPDAPPPGGIIAYPRCIRLLDFSAMHDRPVRPPPAGREKHGPAGFRIGPTLRFEGRGLWSHENSIGFAFQGSVTARLNRCHAFRHVAGTAAGGGPDFFWGFFLDGDEQRFAGGNASLYLENCSVERGGHAAFTDLVGLYARGAFQDAFVRAFETSSLARGIVVRGMGRDVEGTGNQNLLIADAVLDTCRVAGIALSELNRNAIVELRGNYVAMLAGADAALSVQDSGGQLSLLGAQLLCAPGGGVTGLLVRRARGVSATGLQIDEATRPVVLDGAALCSIEAKTNNRAGRVDGAAFSVADSVACAVRATVQAAAGRVARAVAVTGGRDVRVEALSDLG